jgi:hypothetical protein
LHSLKTIGTIATISRVFRYIKWRIDRKALTKRTNQILRKIDIKDRFTEIYETNFWGSQESGSGLGSTLEATSKLRAELPVLFASFSVRSIFDAPCGDFNWMRLVLEKTGIDYIGGDIVEPLIQRLSASNKDPRIRFLRMDITNDRFPRADLWLCRDSLFHLSVSDSFRALWRFLDSNTPYVLTTTCVNDNSFVNADIESGDFRKLDLFSAPYHFPKDVLYRIREDYASTVIPREMCLWSRAQIVAAMTKLGSDYR